MSEKEVKIYHVETQEDYDDLMVKLEEQGYTWFSGKKPTNINEWEGEETAIYLNECGDYTLTYGYVNTAREAYPNIDIIKHKAKGVEQMEKVVVPQFVADWYEGFRYKSLRLLLNYLMCCEDQRIMEWVDKNSPRSAQEVIAKMHLYGYEIEEEKKYYWRKKKEYMFDLEHRHSSYYINLDTDDSTVFLDDKEEIVPYPYRTKFTETEIRKLVSKEDFKKLERVEVDE